MKDIVIKASAIKRELKVLLGCFILSCGVNVYSIIKFNRPVSEIITSIGFVIIFCLIVYLSLWLIRIVLILIKKLLNK